MLVHAENQPLKRPKKNGEKGSVASLKISRQLGCVFQDTEPPKSNSILRKGTKSLRPKRYVQFSKGASRHMKLRERKGPTQGVICRSEPHERGPLAPIIEDRSQETTELQERCARGDAWRWVKSILKIEEKDKATFFSPSEVWCLPAPSLTKS